MIIHPVSSCIIIAILALGMSKIPKWIKYVLVVPLASLLWLSIMIEFSIIGKILFKYEILFNINDNMDKKELEKRKEWLNENIGNKNYCTTFCSEKKNKPDASNLLNFDSYLRFRTKEQVIHYKLTWG